jgi:hypothetical protein
VGVVEHEVGPDGPGVVEVRRAGGGDHAGAEVVGELDDERAGAACGAADEDGLAGLQADVLEQALHGGDAPDRQGGRRLQVELVGDPGQGPRRV